MSDEQGKEQEPELSEYNPDNMRIWQDWMRTPATYAQQVKTGGREFTAIDAYYQFWMATQRFGPVGEGWGWDKPEFQVVLPERPDATLLVCHVNVWLRPDLNGQRLEIPVVASGRLFFKEGGKVDEELYKKLLTNALTKAFSYWGCSADVFLGFFDDNRYVEQMKQAERAGAVDVPGQSSPKPAQNGANGKTQSNTRPAAQSAQTAQPSASTAQNSGAAGAQPAEQAQGRAELYAEMAKLADALWANKDAIRGFIKEGTGQDDPNKVPVEWLRTVVSKWKANNTAFQSVYQRLLKKHNGKAMGAAEELYGLLQSAGLQDLLRVTDPTSIITKTIGKDE